MRYVFTMVNVFRKCSRNKRSAAYHQVLAKTVTFPGSVDLFQAGILIGVGSAGAILETQPYAARSHARLWSSCLLQEFGWNCYVPR